MQDYANPEMLGYFDMANDTHIQRMQMATLWFKKKNDIIVLCRSYVKIFVHAIYLHARFAFFYFSVDLIAYI